MKFKDKTWILISFLTLTIAVIWLGIVVKNTLTKPTLPEDLEQISKPLNPTINQSVFESLSNRKSP